MRSNSKELIAAGQRRLISLITGQRYRSSASAHKKRHHELDKIHLGWKVSNGAIVGRKEERKKGRKVTVKKAP